MANPNNVVNLIGRLAADPRRFVNSDGSSKVSFTIYVDDNYQTGGEWGSQAIPVEAFLGRAVNPASTPFASMHTGDRVAVSAHLEFQVYEANGDTVRVLKAIADSVWQLDSPRTRRERFEARQHQQDQAPAPAAAAGPVFTEQRPTQPPTPQAAPDEAAWIAAQGDDEPPF